MTYNQMMKEKELNENFSFTGLWERAFDVEAVNEMKERAKVKYKGYKTKVVRADGGVAIYVEKKYTQDKYKNDLKEKIESYEARKESARLAFEAELKRLEEQQEEYIKRLKRKLRPEKFKKNKK